VDDDPDFEFDFFDDGDTEEILTGRQARQTQGRPNSEKHLPPDIVKRRRLAAGIVASIIFLIALVALLTTGSDGPAGAYRSYLSRLSTTASASQQLGRSLQQLLASLRRGGSTADPLPRLAVLAQQARGDRDRARQLRPPAGLRNEYVQALAALDYRARGLQGLHDALGSGRGSTNLAAAATLVVVAAPIDRLVTSDVVWHDLVQQPTIAALKRIRLPPSMAPASRFVTDLNISAPSSVAALLVPQSARTPPLSLGATGPAVVAWQKQLNQWLNHTHAPRIVADGTFGPATQTATETLQRAARLTPDGVVGPQTRQALSTALNGRT
jgi:hypothetical protein